MTNLERVEALERRVAETRRLLEKAVAPIAPARASAITCPYCGAPFSSYLDFSRHLKSCKSFKKIAIDPYAGDPPIGGLSVTAKPAERGPDPARERRPGKPWRGYGIAPPGWQPRRRAEKSVEIDGRTYEALRK